jgi:(p)ppGpp synthase/HD superfamily hydrolase
MDMLEKAIGIALKAHLDQKDKYGQPYVLHPIRIMARFRNPVLQQIAILHDVVEDSSWTCEQLAAQNFSAEVVAAVDALTRRSDESYDSLIDRAAINPLALQVKLADLEDNMDIRRMKNITDQDSERLNRYRKAHAKLSAVIESTMK